MASPQYSGLQKELATIVCKYTAIDSMRADVAELAKSPEYLGLFQDVLVNHISMLKTRPQALEDGKITLYDKALLILTSNGKNLHNLGAIELFLDEILGVKQDREVETIEAIFEKNIALRSMVWHVTNQKTEHPSEEHVNEDRDETMIDLPIRTTAKKPDWRTEGRKPRQVAIDRGAAISKMLDTLEQAEDEFHSINESQRGAKYLAAKFLRDTAENTLAYFKANGLGGHRMIPRIEAAYKLGYKKAMVETGGRARPFEMNSDEYCFRARQLRDARPNYGRADCYRPGEAFSLSPPRRPGPGRFRVHDVLTMKQTGPSPALPSGDGERHLHPRDPDTPSSVDPLTPDSSHSGSDDGRIARIAIGRRQTPRKLQTDLREEGERELSSPGSLESSTPRHGERRFRDDTDEEERLAVPYSRAYTAEEERRVVMKFDRRLTLLMAFLYMLSFLDRSNIGNAKIAGMMNDLNLSSSQYQWVLTAFYITYILFEWMTLMYKLVPAHIYIPLCVLGWGLIASFQSLVTSFSALVVLRALLGVFEAGFGPGLPFYLSFFYKREELAFRTGMFLCAAPLATSFAGTLAWFIVWLNKNGPLAPWRALFLFEGFPSVVVASIVWAYIPDRPSKARYLTPRERKVAKWRLRDGQGMSRKQELNARKFDWREVARTLCDPKAYLTAFMFFSCNVAFSSLPVFLPTILNDMGYSTLTSQALSAPPYLFAFIIVLLTASISDRNRSRSPFIILHAVISSLAYLIIALTGLFHAYLPEPVHILIRYICIYPAAAGFFSAITLIITWTMDNQRAKEGKGTGMAILNVIGQCGPLVGTRLYPASDSPWYARGMALCSMFMVFVAILAFALRVLLQRENARPVTEAAEHRGEEEVVAAGETQGLMESSSSSSALGKAGVEKTGNGRFVYII
ncbi:conserved hypothetical protein [Uncinocarpus reesii 1704]|uniref:Major facilitator superfamily (MFS) profile domain-containing protein n=1 Tax=Uncinocarpus reesii (strain UAMH 1704) TaxID=336963 RepID=C4JDP9_UNCRE|nr:uncharacterized protein UREG_00363 [Uncinocarpus reesii 1704]EEP75517.1 conserved hypothetical protein [Uncinocarpus reesii 1704]